MSYTLILLKSVVALKIIAAFIIGTCVGVLGKIAYDKRKEKVSDEEANE